MKEYPESHKINVAASEELYLANREKVLGIANAIARKLGGKVEESKMEDGHTAVCIEGDSGPEGKLILWIRITPGFIETQFVDERHKKLMRDVPEQYPDSLSVEEIAELAEKRHGQSFHGETAK